jgi:N utilization substance protein A
MRVELDDETESAIAVVPERQLSLAIGREGQNARLAARLTGWHVDIRSNIEATADAAKAAEAAAVMAEPTKVEIERLELSTRTVGRLKEAGVTNVGQLLDMSEADMLQIKGFGAKSYAEVSGRLKKLGLLRAKAIAKAPKPEVEVAPPTEEVALEPAVIADIEEAVSDAEAATAEPEVIETAEPATEEIAADVQVEEETPPEVEPVTSEEGIETAPPSEEPEPSVEAEETVDPGVLVAEQSASLRDVSDDIWSIRKAPAIEPGVIRFAEDIADLRGGVTARRGNRGRSGPRGRGRPAKASKRRR